jgi:hypothetical protein
MRKYLFSLLHQNIHQNILLNNIENSNEGPKAKTCK